MINVSDIVDVLKARLDAENSDYYMFEQDYKPAINSAIEWCVTVLFPFIGQKKFIEEIAFPDLIKTRIFQTNKFGRFVFENTTDELWGILGIVVKPYVLVRNDSMSLGLKIRYFNEIQDFINKENKNKPLVTYSYLDGTFLKDNESIYRPELVFTKGGKAAGRGTLEDWEESDTNPFIKGFNLGDELTEYTYLSPQNFGGTSPEISLKPNVSNELVAIRYLATPDPISSETDTIPFPGPMKEIFVEKALGFITYKQGDGVTLANASAKDLISLYNSLK